MFDQRKNEIVVFDKKLAVRSLLALVLAACCKCKWAVFLHMGIISDHIITVRLTPMLL